MKRKNLIIMIIVMCVALSGRLSAEGIVGVSIFTNIETPHPYSKVEEETTLVWSTIIREPGAKWIKIHFSDLQLNFKDYLILVDMKGQVMERISGKDISGKRPANFKVKKNENGRVSFWGPSIDGEEVKIELHCASGKESAWGFIIDEVGVGGKSIFDKDSWSVHDSKEMTGICCSKKKIRIDKERIDKNENNHMCCGEKTGSTDNRIEGIMLYKKGITWNTCKGSLSPQKGNHFFPIEPCIDSQDIVNTVEVRFLMDYTKYNNISNFGDYYTYYGDSFIDSDSNSGGGHLTLRNDHRMNDRLYNATFSDRNVKMQEIYDTIKDYCIVIVIVIIQNCTCILCPCL
jgi:hypothetical protein